MKIRHVLPRAFVHQIGFTRAIREASRAPSDPELLRAFRMIAPRFDWDRLQVVSDGYAPPRWIGYWAAHDVVWASDGILKAVVPNQEAVLALFRDLQKTCFPGAVILPFVGLAKLEPLHMLLHDTAQSELHLESFEQSEAALVHQSRGMPPLSRTSQ